MTGDVKAILAPITEAVRDSNPWLFGPFQGVPYANVYASDEDKSRKVIACASTVFAAASMGWTASALAWLTCPLCRLI